VSSSPPATSTFCGRENDPTDRYCIDCGKPLAASGVRNGQSAAGSSPIAAALAGAAQSPDAGTRSSPIDLAFSGFTAACLRCGKPVDPALPYCAHCGTRLDAPESLAECAACGTAYRLGEDLFCPHCGTRVADSPVRQRGDTRTTEAGRKRHTRPRLSVLDDEGQPATTFTLDRADAVVGRGDADIQFDDAYLSPLHARFEVRDGDLLVRDLGSRNGTWTFIDRPTKLADGDVLLVGSQIIRFRRLGYPGPHPPEADATRRMGSMIPSADVAVLEQLRADGSVRDALHLSPGRTVHIGRESGDWIFPYDPTMSGRHAEIRCQDAEFFVHDAGSRNGVALAVHGERKVKPGQRILVGDQILRVESV
jgi:pSer/pThr/pTyr-binding forkhead associated (FHA) protein/predicted amidophosphoribosyltransferase